MSINTGPIEPRFGSSEVFKPLNRGLTELLLLAVASLLFV